MVAMTGHGSQVCGLGRFIALEVKRPDAPRTPDHQLRFLEIVRKRGGFGCVVHSVDEALAAVGRAERGERE